MGHIKVTSHGLGRVDIRVNSRVRQGGEGWGGGEVKSLSIVAEMVLISCRSRLAGSTDAVGSGEERVGSLENLKRNASQPLLVCWTPNISVVSSYSRSNECPTWVYGDVVVSAIDISLTWSATSVTSSDIATTNIAAAVPMSMC